MIDAGTLGHCLRLLRATDIPTVDLTGGVPEMNPHFRSFVTSCRELGRAVLVRCNLTILFEPGQEDLVEFYVRHGVEIVASMPYYQEGPVDAQRGRGVFEKSIDALRLLNDAGYGRPGTGLRLSLVYNPAGAFLPPSQSAIEADFRRELGERHGIVFTSLYTIANMPIGRFRTHLERTGAYDGYMERLIRAYNPQAAERVMCRSLLSVGWDGRLFDCDFNQMLGIGCNHGAPTHISQFDADAIAGRRITVDDHCYGCTAGAGSSCGGAVVPEALAPKSAAS
jgi:radical SAM/Cys-rich protein